MPRIKRAGRAARRRERGSAYLIALMVLLVVTVIGLGLAFVTQTEFLIGSNERVSQRIFYAAESGLAIATARALVAGDKSFLLVQWEDPPDYTNALKLKTRLEIFPVMPIAAPPCSYCEINNEFAYGNRSFYRVTHAMTVRASLIGPGNPGEEPVVAQKLLSDMIEVQPWPDATPPADEATAKPKI